MLKNKIITVNSLYYDEIILCKPELLMSPVIYSLGDNLEGIRMLLDKYHAPLQDFLEDLLKHTKSKEVALYLLNEKRLDLYAKHEAEKSGPLDNDYFFFSKENIFRLKKDTYHGLRPKDHRLIGNILTKLTSAIIVDIEDHPTLNFGENGDVLHQAPTISCASYQDARILFDYLHNKCGFSFYRIFRTTLYAYKDSSNFSNNSLEFFIKVIVKKLIGNSYKYGAVFGLFNSTLSKESSHHIADYLHSEDGVRIAQTNKSANVEANAEWEYYSSRR